MIDERSTLAPRRRRAADAGDHARRRAVVLTGRGGRSGRARAGALLLRLIRLRHVIVLAGRARDYPRGLPAVHEPADLARRPVGGFDRDSTSTRSTTRCSAARRRRCLPRSSWSTTPSSGSGPTCSRSTTRPTPNPWASSSGTTSAPEAHNLYLGIGAELGIPGLIVFLLSRGSRSGCSWPRDAPASIRRPDLERLTTPYLLALLTYYVTGPVPAPLLRPVLLADARRCAVPRRHHAP